MRYQLLFVIPYVIVLVVFGFSAAVLQHDQETIKTLALRQCDAQRAMYAVISHGLRRRAGIELAAKLPKVEGNIKRLRANALSLEANEMDRVSETLPNCPQAKK